MRRTPYTCKHCGEPIMSYRELPTTPEEMFYHPECLPLATKAVEASVHKATLNEPITNKEE